MKQPPPPPALTLPHYAPDIDPATLSPGRRRLKDLHPDIRRPLECQLSALRRKPQVTEAEISHKLDLHPDDLDALARTAGQL